ncbi:GIN domain-containing protein [Aquimarina spongiae]|uniref:Putative auto-transporter adhesin head GIN domain-containing protein n=1 Tax=Aquimarina spongiae TaxID=570521 RepID=A0A1M6BE15_9FLAO|nr:DUF2807 domain-containing protein [Aquimarina spongiae]SHI46982.1 Protein of unknown function [Aquimarina spongiae]
MRTLTFLFFLMGCVGYTQIKGNGIIETKKFDINNVHTIKINFYADVLIDTAQEESLTITTDNNLFQNIDKEVVDGVLSIGQLEWIQPTKKAKIIIGAPGLKAVEQGTHDTTKIINLNTQEIRLMALVGKIIVEGKTQELRIGNEVGTVDASGLIAENATIQIWSWGRAKVNVMNSLDSDLNDNAKLIVTNTPKILKGDSKRMIAKSSIKKDASIEYINFKIKNNSFSRNNFFVVGPKPDGSKFGYGFPMMPGSVRKENWTTGTKVYKVNSLGFRKLLVTIKAEDKDQIVKLF